MYENGISYNLTKYSHKLYNVKNVSYMKLWRMFFQQKAVEIKDFQDGRAMFCFSSKSISEDTITLFLFALLFNISRL